jgi:hypothetical protein
MNQDEPPARRCRSWVGWLVGTFVALVLGISMFGREVQDLTHWPLKRLRARVVCHTWPNDPFDPATWRSTPPSERYRLANTLLKSQQILGRSASEVAEALGGPADAFMAFKLKDAGDNLWYTLVVECPGGAQCLPRVDMAYFDPS